MTSREKILSEVLKNQPARVPMPDISIFRGPAQDNVQEYMDTFVGIGGRAFAVDDIESIKVLIKEHYNTKLRIVTTLDEFFRNHLPSFPAVWKKAGDDKVSAIAFMATVLDFGA